MFMLCIQLQEKSSPRRPTTGAQIIDSSEHKLLPSFKQRAWQGVCKQFNYLSMGFIGDFWVGLAQTDRLKSLWAPSVDRVPSLLLYCWLDSSPNNKLFLENRGFILLCGMREGFSLNLAPFRKDYPLITIGVGSHGQPRRALILQCFGCAVAVRWKQPCRHVPLQLPPAPRSAEAMERHKPRIHQRANQEEPVVLRGREAATMHREEPRPCEGLRCKEIWGLRPALAHCRLLISQEEITCRRCWFLPPWCQPQQISRNQLSMLFPGYRSEQQASGQVFGQLHSMLEVQDCQISAKIQQLRATQEPIANTT